MKRFKLDLLSKLLFKVCAIGAVFCLGAYLVLNASQMHGDYIREKVGSRTYKLMHESGRGGGTGFLVKAKSGQTYVLTNAHICGNDGEKTVTAYIPGKKRPLKLEIIEVFNKADLCLVEAPKDAPEGLSLASDVRAGEELAIVGHPKLMPLTLSRGQLIGYQKVQLILHLGQCKVEDDNHKTYEIFFGLEVCVVEYEAGLTNALALPGNSGSATVNFYGNVVGVLFAGAQDNWGIIVSLSDIKDFLSVY